MKKLLIGLLVFTLVFALQISAFAQEPVFQKSQSYELADLVKKLTPANDENCNLFLNKIYIQEDLNIYWNNWASWKKENLSDKDDKNKRLGDKQENRMTESYPYYREGVAGLLFNNQGIPKYEQKWVDGKLQNRGMEVGYEAVVGVCGYGENKPQFIKITTVAPATIGLLLGEKSAKGSASFSDLSLHSYFAKHGYTVEHVKENQNLASYGADLCKLTHSGKRPVWVMVETSIGNKLQSTSIYLFFSYDDAMKEWKDLS